MGRQPVVIAIIFSKNPLNLIRTFNVLIGKKEVLTPKEDFAL